MGHGVVHLEGRYFHTLLYDYSHFVYMNLTHSTCIYGNYKYSDPNEIWKNATKYSVTCRLGHEGHPIRSGASRYYSNLELLPHVAATPNHRTSLFWLDYNLQTMVLNECSAKSRINRDWGRYIIDSKGVVGREWSWKCEDEEAVGFMIKPQQQQSTTDDNNKILVDQLEIRLSTRVKSIQFFSKSFVCFWI